MNGRQESNSLSVSGWETDTELIREFDRPANVEDAVISTVLDAVEEWPELSDTPPLAQFVAVENLDGLFKTEATDYNGWPPSVSFQFQSCRVSVLYGPTVRVVVSRDP